MNQPRPIRPHSLLKTHKQHIIAMIVRCPNCNKAYKIPEQKLEQGKELAFHCLSCKTGIVRITSGIKNKPKKSGQFASALAQALQRDMMKKSPKKGPDPPPAADQKKEESPISRTPEEIRRSLVRETGGLLPMPQIVIRAREIIANPMKGLKELANLVEKDQAITTAVLRLANSAYYGLSGKVSNIQHASVMLGELVLGEVITTAAAAGLMEKNLKGYGMTAADLWRHAMFVAVASKMIAEKNNPESVYDAYIAGLIHDVGKIVLNDHVLENKDLFSQSLKNGPGDHLSAEQEVFGFTHCDVGSDLCRSWGIPKLIAGAIKYHHDPSYSLGNILSYMVYMADSLALVHEARTKGEAIEEGPDQRMMGVLDLDEGQLAIIMEKAGKAVEQIADSL